MVRSFHFFFTAHQLSFLWSLLCSLLSILHCTLHCSLHFWAFILIVHSNGNCKVKDMARCANKRRTIIISSLLFFSVVRLHNTLKSTVKSFKSFKSVRKYIYTLEMISHLLILLNNSLMRLI